MTTSQTTADLVTGGGWQVLQRIQDGLKRGVVCAAYVGADGYPAPLIAAG